MRRKQKRNRKSLVAQPIAQPIIRYATLFFFLSNCVLFGLKFKSGERCELLPILNNNEKRCHES